MFSSRRKSREPVSMVQNSSGLQQQNEVNSNALAAASAIGNAMKTGAPIPRSNSLQRSSSIQRSSSFFSRKPISRSGSLIGLQGAPQNFQQPYHHHHGTPQRSQSLTAGSAYNKRLSSKKSASSLQSTGPRMVKKHIPGPYGLVTIEVPAEDEHKPLIKPKGSRSFTKQSSDKGSLRSFQSQSSSPRVKRAVVNEPLKEVDEEIPEDFEQNEPLPHVDIPESKYVTNNNPNLGLIQEEEDTSANNNDVASDLDKLKLEKENEESELQKKLEQEQDAEQNFLSAKHESIDGNTPDIASDTPTEIKDIKKTIVNTEPTDSTIDHAGTPDLENDVLDEYTDAPSTAKSNDTITAGQSSYTTTGDSENEQELPHSSSMAKQLRPTIPSLQVNNSKVDGANADVKDSAALNGSTIPNDTAVSSLYSNEENQEEGRGSRANKFVSNDSSQDLQIPARSSKRDSSISPRKSALKTTSNSTVNLHDSPSHNSNPANAAYLSLTTAENTRLNALSASNLPATNLARSNSSRTSLRQEPHTNGFKTSMRQQPTSQQQPAQNGMRTSMRQAQQGPKVPPAHQMQKRPQSVATATPINNKPVRPQSAQSFRPQSQVSPRFSRQQPQQQSQSPSNAAALNAAMKKAEPPSLVRSSSFEKDRPAEKHSAFKRKSLRDPSMNNHANVESQVGFYRQQGAQQQQQHEHQQNHHESPARSHGGGFAGFRSRFDDSDSESESAPTLRNNKSKKKFMEDFAPPPNNPTLRKPKSQFTLRSTSNNAVPDNQSPAKSLPEKRNTRYFSETDKEQLFNEHLKKAEANMNGEPKKKSKFGGKLKKLFGRGN